MVNFQHFQVLVLFSKRIPWVPWANAVLQRFEARAKAQLCDSKQVLADQRGFWPFQHVSTVQYILGCSKGCSKGPGILGSGFWELRVIWILIFIVGSRCRWFHQQPFSSCRPFIVQCWGSSSKFMMRWEHRLLFLCVILSQRLMRWDILVRRSAGREPFGIPAADRAMWATKRQLHGQPLCANRRGQMFRHWAAWCLDIACSHWSDWLEHAGTIGDYLPTLFYLASHSCPIGYAKTLWMTPSTARISGFGDPWRFCRFGASGLDKPPFCECRSQPVG